MRTELFLTRSVFFGFCVLLFGCATCQKTGPAGQSQTPPFKRNQLVLVYPSNLSQSAREKIRSTLLKNYQLSDNNVQRCVCDSSIEVITAENADRFASDTSSKPASTSHRVGVQGVEVVLSKNVLFQQPLRIKAQRLIPLQYDKRPGSLRIAIIDTGLDTTDNRYFSASSFSRFLLPATASDYAAVGITNPASINDSRFFGWNFFTNSQNIMDDHAHRHGTVVTGLLLSEIEKTGPEIIMLKAFDATGSSDLFTIRCALKFAEKAGAKIINASWGYDGTEENAALHDAISSLERNNILLVAAAGNAGHNTDVIPHWPGSFSTSSPRGLDNVIAVATATKNGICLPRSNYSGNRVDVAVAGRGDDCGFFNIFGSTGSLRDTGTSYATAIMSGVIANQFATISIASPVKTTVLTQVLNGQPVISSLNGKVRTSKRIIQ